MDRFSVGQEVMVADWYKATIVRKISAGFPKTAYVVRFRDGSERPVVETDIRAIASKEESA